MCVRIGVEDLAANALIELLKRSDAQRFVSYHHIEAYGLQVAKLLQQEGEEVMLIMSRPYTDEMLWYYEDFFEEIVEQGEAGIALKEGKTVEDLREKFRGYLGIKVLLALVNEESLKALQVA